MPPLPDLAPYIRAVAGGEGDDPLAVRSLLGWAVVSTIACLGVALVVAKLGKPGAASGAKGSGRRTGNNRRGSGNGSTGSARGATTIFYLPPRGEQAKAFEVTDERMDWYEDMITKIYDLNHGIFFGEQASKPMKPWKKGVFRLALQQIRDMVKDEGGWPGGGTYHDPLDDIALTQRLMATDLDVKGSMKLVRSYKEYRSERPGGVVPSLGWVNSGTIFIPCEDRLGRPVMWVRAKYHIPGTCEQYRNGYRATMDALKAHSLRKRSVDGWSEDNPIEQYVVIFDCKDVGTRNLDLESFKATLHEAAYHYPNMGGQIYVININRSITWGWGIACKIMHPRIRRKCLLVTGREVNKSLEKLIGLEKLPPSFGGTGTEWPPPAEAESFEDQVGDLLASVYRRCNVVPVGAKPSRHCEDFSEQRARMREEMKAQRLREQDGMWGNLGCCFGC